MPSGGMCGRVVLVRTDVSEERIASNNVKIISELGVSMFSMFSMFSRFNIN
jgi:hypothetical protein